MSIHDFSFLRTTPDDLAAMREGLKAMAAEIEHKLAFADERILCVIGCDMNINAREGFYKLLTMADDEQIEVAANLMRAAIARELLVRDQIRTQAEGN